MACSVSDTITRNWVGRTDIEIRHRNGFSSDGKGTHTGQHNERFKSGFFSQLVEWARQVDNYARAYHPDGAGVAWVGDVGACDDDPPSSYHAQARAYDLTKIHFTDNSICDMNWSWNQNLTQRRRYLAIAALCRVYFGNVLTAWYNSAHSNHIHIDNAYANVPPIRDDVASDTSLVKAACKYLNGADITINGNWNESAFQNLRDAFGMGCLDIRGNYNHTFVFLTQIARCGLNNVGANGVPDWC
jgi:hypothetical protein